MANHSSLCVGRPSCLEKALWRSFSETIDFNRFRTEQSVRSEFLERKGNGHLYGTTERHGTVVSKQALVATNLKMKQGIANNYSITSNSLELIDCENH